MDQFDKIKLKQYKTGTGAHRAYKTGRTLFVDNVNGGERYLWRTLFVANIICGEYYLWRTLFVDNIICEIVICGDRFLGSIVFWVHMEGELFGARRSIYGMQVFQLGQ